MTPKQFYELCGKADILTGAWSGTPWEDLPEDTKINVVSAVLSARFGPPDSPMVVLHDEHGAAFSIKLGDIKGFDAAEAGSIMFHFVDGELAQNRVQELLDIAVGRYNAAVKEFSR